MAYNSVEVSAHVVLEDSCRHLEYTWDLRALKVVT